MFIRTETMNVGKESQGRLPGRYRCRGALEQVAGRVKSLQAVLLFLATWREACAPLFVTKAKDRKMPLAIVL